MVYVALRRDLGANQTRDDVIDWVAASAATTGVPLEWQAGYWAPANGRVLSVFSAPTKPSPLEPADILDVVPITAEEHGPELMEPATPIDDPRLGLVLVRRHVEPLTRAEFKTMALQAIMCAYEYTDMRWIRSWWAPDEQEIMCVFKTRTHELVREHARRSRLPCDEIHDAVELAPRA